MKYIIMKRLTRSLLPLAALLAAASGVLGQTVGALHDLIPLDPAVRTGKLSNGLTYFIRQNAKPEKRLELRLVVNAGAVLERDDQQGLAHFLEHMAFNGTKNFKKHELIDFLEGIGMRFGADLNAYTSFDETVYMLQVPAEELAVIDKAMQILEDWAHNITMEGEEIDKERGVIMEEWRLSRGADSRIREELFPYMFYNSPYAHRLPIGKTDVLQNFKHDVLREFYRDWYRPDLMAVVAVGDYDPIAIEKLIKAHFDRIPRSSGTPVRTQIPVPDNPGTLVGRASDPEASGSEVNIYFKHDPPSHASVGDYRRGLIEAMVSSMLNERLEEIARSSNAPFMGAQVGIWDFNTAKRMFAATISVANDAHMRGFNAVLAELERARRHGFTQPELDRARADMMKSFEQYYNERDKNESGRFCREYVSMFLGRESAPGIAYEYELVKKYVPAVTIADANAVIKALITDQNRVVTVTAPKNESVALPTESEILAAFDAMRGLPVEAYVDKAGNKPLLARMPAAGKVMSERTIPEISVVEWTLSNGVRVVLKPTDFKNDEVLMTAFSPGGLSLVPDADLVPASTAAGLVAQGGVGEFSRIELGKMMAGKSVSVTPFINELQEGFQGSATPQDLETMMQLIYLYVTAPRRDTTAFSVFRQQMQTLVQNRAADPDQVFSDTVSSILRGRSPRYRPMDQSWLADLDLDKSMAAYRDRFADVGDFTFVFVGNFTLSQMRSLSEKYLAALPSHRREESWKDWGMRTPRGVVNSEVKKGLEPKSTVILAWTGDFDFARESRFRMGMVMDILDIRLRESLREESGGTYAVGSFPRLVRWPKPAYDLVITFGCAPTNVADLANKAIAVVEKFKAEGPTAEELAKVKEIHLRDRETNLKQNRFWLSSLQTRLTNQEDPRTIPQEDRLVSELKAKDLQDAARLYFNGSNTVRVVLNPEK